MKILSRNPEPVAKFYLAVAGIEFQRRKTASGEWELTAELPEPPPVPEEPSAPLSAEEEYERSLLPPEASKPKRASGPLIVVVDMDKALEYVKANGGVSGLVVTFKGKPGVIAFCTDPQGNSFTLSQPDANWD